METTYFLSPLDREIFFVILCLRSHRKRFPPLGYTLFTFHPSTNPAFVGLDDHGEPDMVLEIKKPGSDREALNWESLPMAEKRRQLRDFIESPYWLLLPKEIQDHLKQQVWTLEGA